MQRLLSILLTLVLSLGPTLSAVPANALAGRSSSDESHLPACCRKNGAHHCAAAMQLTQSASTKTTLSAKNSCPNWPGTVASTAASITAVIHSTTASAATSLQPYTQPHSEQAQNRTPQQTHPKRGPPSETSI